MARTREQTLVDLETRFWQSLVDQDTDAACSMLSEPALMVSAHGVIKFDHRGYRRMADQGAMVLTAYELSDMDVVFPNDETAVLSYRVKQRVAPRGKDDVSDQEMNDTSTWVHGDSGWKCVVHTETPAEPAGRSH